MTPVPLIVLERSGFLELDAHADVERPACTTEDAQELHQARVLVRVRAPPTRAAPVIEMIPAGQALVWEEEDTRLRFGSVAPRASGTHFLVGTGPPVFPPPLVGALRSWLTLVLNGTCRRPKQTWAVAPRRHSHSNKQRAL